MASQPQGQRDRGPGSDLVASALEELVEAGQAISRSATFGEVAGAVAEAAARATGADVALVRLVDSERQSAAACAVYATSPTLAAELEGTRLPVHELPAGEVDALEAAGPALRRAAERAGTKAVLQLPILTGESVTATLDLLRGRRPFDAQERALARIAAGQIELALRALEPDGRATNGVAPRARALALAGDALSAAADDVRTPQQVARLAVEASGARAGLLWRREERGAPSLVASHGAPELLAGAEDAHGLAEAAFEGRKPISVETAPAGLSSDTSALATIQLGEPALGALQLVFEGDAPGEEELRRLATFGARAAHAWRAGERARSLVLELDRTRALLEIVAQANEQLSLAHALETAVERVAELLDAERIAVYLREDGRLVPAAGRGLAGPHARVGERLLHLVLGPFRGRGIAVIEDAAANSQLAPVREAVAESGIEAAIALPLIVTEDVVGLLAAYPERGRTFGEHDLALLGALAAQLAVAVQNARLHERATRLGAEREHALSAERQAARRLRALYEISRSFAQSLSLETTLDAIANTVVELLNVDAAILRVPDERRENLVARSTAVREDRLGPAVATLLARPQQLAKLPGRRLFRMGRPLVLDPSSAGSLGASYELLVPFLEKGSTAAVVPIATPAELLATLTLFSLDPTRPIDDETLETASTMAGHAALAIDNARLYQQRKEFADTMQRSLLPRMHPKLEGLEIGDVYESSARVELGGDVYDYLPLGDGRLAVVLGDVTGHGIDATADMAMAKFVFRSLAREHSSPADFLAAANDVVVGEIGAGKFITMVYLAVDGARGEVACASAGHPPPRVVAPDGSVRGLEARGLALGVEEGQRYVEVRESLEPGAAVVLYTDGVLEARRGGEQYGVERLDRTLARGHDLPAGELAAAVLASCRTFAGGALVDDCAVVVIKRTD